MFSEILVVLSLRRAIINSTKLSNFSHNICLQLMPKSPIMNICHDKILIVILSWDIIMAVSN